MKTLKLRQSLLIVLCVLPFATIAACQAPPANQPQGTTVITGVVSTTTSNSPTDTVTPSTSFPQSINVSLSSAPKVGDTVDLTVRIRNFDTRTTRHVTKTRLQFMWRNTEGIYHDYRNPVEVPLSEVLLGSTADWSGDLRADSPLEFTIPVKLLKPGLWDITAYADMENGFTVYDRIYLGTTAEKAGIRGTEAERLGQLEWMKDYRDVGGEGLGKTGYPLYTSLDMPNPPQLGKPIELSWSVTSGYDTGKVKITINFYLAEKGQAIFVTTPLDKVLLVGKLTWEGTLKKGSSISDIATVVFPEEGDWEVTIQCDDLENNSTGISNIYLNISANWGRWGWIESHEPPLDPNRTPLTPPAIPIR